MGIPARTAEDLRYTARLDFRREALPVSLNGAEFIRNVSDIGPKQAIFKVLKMFAVIEDGSRQHRVQEGDLLSVDFRSDAEVGAALTFDRVLLANGGGASIIGRPLIDGAAVEGEVVLDEEKGPKLEVQKIRRRKNSRRHNGHRQKYTRVKITSISVPNLEIVQSSETSAEAPAAEPSVISQSATAA